MTNPNNAVGTNGAFGGRTSPNAFNDVLGAYTKGILSGWACSPSTGLTVILGGNGTTRDVAIAEDSAGNKTTIDNISMSPISVTISAAPSTNSRIDSIVAYVDNPPTGSSTSTDNPSACGLIVVKGTPAANPVAPNNSTIRSAITADGASGTTAYYVILANVTIASGTTTITSGMIASGSNTTMVQSAYNMRVLGGDYSSSEVNTGFTWIDGKYIYKKTINCGNLPNSTTKTVAHNISNISSVIKFDGVATNLTNDMFQTLPFSSATTATDSIELSITATDVQIVTKTSYWSNNYPTSYVTIYYTKSA